MKVIIAGSRTIKNYDVTARWIKFCPFDITEIVSGGAIEGPDAHAIKFANANGFPLKVMKADWSLGEYAGHIRNEAMGDYADCLLAIHDRVSKGTLHMIQYMRKLRKPVRVIPYTLPGDEPSLFDKLGIS